MAVDGRTVTALTRDLRRRTVRVADDTGEGRVEHEQPTTVPLELVRRSRGGRTLRWTYDADGHRTSMSTPDGATTAYGYDAAGRLSWVDHSVLGRAAFDRDAAGRLTSALAGGLIQAWDHRDGFVVAHSVTDGDGATRTEVERDEDGRVRRIRTGDGHGSRTADYAYDGASQLVEVRSADGTARSVHRWAHEPPGGVVRPAV
ncbi:MAG: type IV secretion protein Rhs, partial [Variovorax sp.]